MKDETRHRLFIILSMAVIIGWYALVVPPRKPAQSPVKDDKSTPATQITDAQPAPAAGAPDDSSSSPDSLQPVAALEREILVDTPLYTAVLTTQGGVLRRFELKSYQSNDRSGLKDIIDQSVVHPPLFARIRGLKAAEQGDHLPYVYDGPSEIMLAGKTEEVRLPLRYRDSAGVEVHKDIFFSPTTYSVRAEYRVIAPAVTAARKFQPVYVLALDHSKAPKTSTARMGTHAIVGASSTDRHEFGALADKSIKITDDPRFAGFEDHYFLTAILPENPKHSALIASRTSPNQWETAVEGPELLAGADAATAEVSAVRYYLGPKTDAALLAVDQKLEAAINYGFGQTLIKPIAKFLLLLLRIFHGVAGDWGLAILMLTVIVRVALFPLAIKQFHSMQAMATLKPKMDALKEKYKDDKVALNQATMDLFREHKVNPLSGCLPILPQIPIFLGLYVSLDTSLELRHAAFLGTWIQDLAIHDPYYVLPLITCATMAISMKLTPSQMDPIQQKVMMIMPIVMFFLFMNIAAGLVLYWSASNVFSIGQQLYFNARNKRLSAAREQDPSAQVVPTTAKEVSGEPAGSRNRKKSRR